MQSAGIERDPQWLAGPEQVLLADHLVERGRAQPFGKRRAARRFEIEAQRGGFHGSLWQRRIGNRPGLVHTAGATGSRR